MEVISHLSLMDFCLALRVLVVGGCDDRRGRHGAEHQMHSLKLFNVSLGVCDKHKHLVLIWWYACYFTEVYQTPSSCISLWTPP